jgi:hypothetical protein
MAAGLPLDTAPQLLTSYSLFRVRPHRRTIVWEQHTNRVIPQRFVEGFILGQEAGLSDGETAFAVFANSVGGLSGIVVPDGQQNLRGTYSLADHILGLRNNAFIPLRSSREGAHRGDLLAIVVVSFGIPDVFPGDVTSRLAPVCQRYAEAFELLLDAEQAGERVEFEAEYLEQRRDVVGLVVPDAVSADDPRLPAAAEVICDVNFNSRRVRVKRATYAVSPALESGYWRTELERRACELPREESVRPPIPNTACRVGDLVLHCGDLPANRVRDLKFVLRTISRCASVTTQRLSRSVATEAHLRMEILKGLGTGLMDLLTRPWDDLRAERYRTHVLMLHRSGGRRFIRAISHLHAQLADAGSARLLVFGATGNAPTLLRSPTLTRPRGAAARALTVDHSATSLLTQLEHELRDRYAAVSWCRSIGYLIEAAARTPNATTFAFERFCMNSRETGQQWALLSSLVFSDRGMLTIAKERDARHRVEFRRGDVTVATHWRLRRAELPLAVGVVKARRSITINESVSTRGLPEERVRTIHLAAVPVDRKSSNGPADSVSDLFRIVAAREPIFQRALDRVAIFPLADRRGAADRTFRGWGSASGEQRLLVLGALDTPRIRYDEREPGMDPRFEQLVNVLGRLDRQRRVSDLYQLSRAIVGRFHHKSDEDLQRLRVLAENSDERDREILLDADWCLRTLGNLRTREKTVTRDELVSQTAAAIDWAVSHVRGKKDAPVDKRLIDVRLDTGNNHPRVRDEQVIELIGNVLSNALLESQETRSIVSISTRSTGLVIENYARRTRWRRFTAGWRRIGTSSDGSGGTFQIWALAQLLGVKILPGSSAVRDRRRRRLLCRVELRCHE